jgi:hypothetical protein
MDKNLEDLGKNISLKGYSFRFICKIDYVPSHIIKTVKSLPGNKLEVCCIWPSELKAIPEPISTPINIQMLDSEGQTIDQYWVTFDGYEALPIDLNYSKGEPLSFKYIFNNVSYRHETNLCGESKNEQK